MKAGTKNYWGQVRGDRLKEICLFVANRGKVPEFELKAYVACEFLLTERKAEEYLRLLIGAKRLRQVGQGDIELFPAAEREAKT